jgi:hypothetical protein
MTPKSLAWIAFAAFNLQMGFAQDFQRSYSIPENGQIVINTSGNIKVQAFPGQKVEVIAYKKGAKPESIEIEDKSAGNRIELRLKFPQFDQWKPDPGKIDPAKDDPAKRDPSKAPPGRFHRDGFRPPPFDFGDSVDFEVRVPQLKKYETSLHTIRGNIEISGLSGAVWAVSDRGNIDVKGVHGSIMARSNDGGIRGDLAQTKEVAFMTFASIGGDVVVKAPGDLESNIYLFSGSGRLNTDFPIKIQERRYGSGREAQGTLGSSQQRLSITSAWGSVSLLKK